MRTLNNVDLSTYSTMGIGGVAETVYFPETLEDVKDLFKRHGSNINVIGGCSNIVFEDGIHKVPYISTKELAGNRDLNFECGFLSSDLVKYSIDNGLDGFTCLTGIPGTLGGAVIGNAGVKGSIFDVIEEILIVESNGDDHIRDHFSPVYRNGNVKGFIYSVTFKGIFKNREEIKKEYELIMDKRKDQPHGKSCGCIFKNTDNCSAGYLIDRSGLKGASNGDLVVSRIHANYIMNTGLGKFSDLLGLIEIIKERVYGEFGEELELEVKIFRR